MAAAEAFYKTVVGWTTTPFDGAGMPYSMWTRPDGAPMGGVMTLPDELKAHKVPAALDDVHRRRLARGGRRARQAPGRLDACPR